MSWIDGLRHWMQFGSSAKAAGMAAAVVHFAPELTKLAKGRGVQPSAVSVIACSGCGAVGEGPIAFATFFGHWAGCACLDRDLHFLADHAGYRRLAADHAKKAPKAPVATRNGSDRRVGLW